MRAFVIGAIVSITSILWTLKTTKDISLTPEESATVRACPTGVGSTFREIWEALREMPVTMRQLAVMKLFQWHAMFWYWQYVVLALAKTLLWDE